MICRYSLTIKCRCPVDDLTDSYLTEIDSPSIIQVETILREILYLGSEPKFQEDLTASLARSFGCKVTTTGYHSGIKTVVVAP